MTTHEPLLLLHGLMMSADAWADVIPLLADQHEVIAPTAVGHRGGPPLIGKATIRALTDETERLLDVRGLDRVHVAGNSMGGWMAIELARRGRALTVCAFSPAGFWTPGTPDETRASNMVRRTRRRVRVVRPLAPALLRFAYMRRQAMRDVAIHGERFTLAQALGAVRDVACCLAAEEMLRPSEGVAPLDPLPCPMTLAWSANDKILPPDVYGATARERLPQAKYLLLPGVGHVPMIDNPRLCADTILATTADQSGREVTLLTYGTPELAAILPNCRTQTDRLDGIPAHKPARDR
jgi:pimeloyl-ACP methyl ester carboxylesterase